LILLLAHKNLFLSNLLSFACAAFSAALATALLRSDELEQLAQSAALLASRRHEPGQLKVERCRPLQKSVLLGPGCKVFDWSQDGLEGQMVIAGARHHPNWLNLALYIRPFPFLSRGVRR
jgi:hypothetical protein